MVRQVVQLFYKEIRGLHQAAYVLALFALASQVLAILRDRLLAHMFGAGIELDLYYAAFRIPDLLFVIFASVLSVYVLIPFVVRAQKKSKAQASQLLSMMFSFFLLTYSGLALLLFIFAPSIIPVFFPSLTAANEELLVVMVRILLLQPFLLGISTLASVITQMQHRFIVYAVSPIVYNVGIIIGIAYFYPILGLTGLVWGVILGAAGHLLVQLPLICKSSLSFRIVVPKLSVLKPIIQTAIPRAITLSLNQVVLLALTIFAATMTVGSVAVFQLGFNLQSVPLTIIGVSYSVAAFPVLANLLADSEYKKFSYQMQTAFRHIIFWSLPVVALVVVLRAHIVRLTLGTGNFTWDDTRLTAAVLAIFVLSLLSQTINLLTIRAFYANSNTKTPLIVATIGSAISIVGGYVGYVYLYNMPAVRSFIESVFRIQDVPGTEVVLLALGFSVGVTIQAIIMLVCLHRTFPSILRPLGQSALISLGVALSGSAAAWLTLQFLVEGINQQTFIGILLQGGAACIVGVVCMYLLHFFLRSPELVEINKTLKRRFVKQTILGRPQSDTL